MATLRTTSTSATTGEATSTPVNRVLESVSRAFDSISPALLPVTLWNMRVTQRLGFTDIPDRPVQFIEGLSAIYDEAQTRVIEARLVKEIQGEFGLAETNQTFPEAVRAALMS
jgi:hypothetical protein